MTGNAYTREDAQVTDMATLAEGDRVRIIGKMLGTIRLDDPYRFTDYIAGEGDTGEIVEPAAHIPEGWVLVKLDAKHDDGSTLYAPLYPGMLEREA